jgi:hypothetical protein
MRKIIITAIAALALALAGTAGAALAPGTFESPAGVCPGVSAVFSGGVLHLAKPCPTPTNASAGADITGLNGQAFASASFTLATASQCQGGSPRFNIVTTSGTFFLGCNNVTPTLNGDGTSTYTFAPADLVYSGAPPAPAPGTITGASILIDVQGTADISKITVNGAAQVPTPTTGDRAKACKKGGWKTFTNPTFKNQGQCVSHMQHLLHHGR